MNHYRENFTAETDMAVDFQGVTMASDIFSIVSGFACMVVAMCILREKNCFGLLNSFGKSKFGFVGSSAVESMKAHWGGSILFLIGMVATAFGIYRIIYDSQNEFETLKKVEDL